MYGYVDVLYYKQRNLLLVSATYCDHLQGDILRRIYYVELNILCVQFKLF
jgi:hypothetical protein